MQEQEPPELLYHFTDAAGLIGIVESNAIWLSLATSLNDRSEVTYGLQLAQDVLNQSSARDSAFGTTLRDFLSGKLLPTGDTIRLLPFVASLCEQPESSSHWLHYGRSGTGFAVAMGRSLQARWGSHLWISEATATFGLIAVIRGPAGAEVSRAAGAVATYITAAYWFTSSTSFANPAVTIARALTNTFAGIRPADVPGFIGAQLVGGALAVLVFTWLMGPRQGD